MFIWKAVYTLGRKPKEPNRSTRGGLSSTWKGVIYVREYHPQRPPSPGNAQCVESGTCLTFVILTRPLDAPGVFALPLWKKTKNLQKVKETNIRHREGGRDERLEHNKCLCAGPNVTWLNTKTTTDSALLVTHVFSVLGPWKLNSMSYHLFSCNCNIMC